MPEGPEIWRAADEIENAISGKEVEQLFFAFDELKEYETELLGLKIESVTPRGKAIITSFENDLNVYSHNQLYGKWMIRERGEIPETNRSLRMAIHTKDKSAFLYSASQIQVITNAQIEEHPYIQKLGPDVVHPKTTYEEVLARYQSKTFINRRLASLLLDQGFLSGLGNYLRSEILFNAKVNPDVRPCDCTEKQMQDLAKYSLDLARQSYKTAGIVTPPELVQALIEEGVPPRQYRFYAYGREGKPCYLCGEPIQVIKTGGRKIFYCEKRQGAVSS